MEWRSQSLGVTNYWAFPWPGGGDWPWPSGAWHEESGARLGPARPWERSVTGIAIQLNGDAIALNGSAGVGWGGEKGVSFCLKVAFPENCFEHSCSKSFPRDASRIIKMSADCTKPVS